MSEVRNNIIARIRAGRPKEHPLPQVPMYPVAGDPVENFIARLIGFDGRAVEFRSREEALAWMKEQPEIAGEKSRIFSSVKDVTGNFPTPGSGDLRKAGDVETFVTEGLLGVGEMGAVWVTNESLGEPVCALLARRVFILLDSAKIIGGMHEAYAKIRLGETHYGSFFTGPSATADIEAVHITGAQGPLALTVLLYNRPDAPLPPKLLVNPNEDVSIWSRAEE